MRETAERGILPNCLFPNFTNDPGEYYDVGPSTYDGGNHPWRADDPSAPSASNYGFTGVIFQRSTLNEKHIIDGLSKTAIIGEKYIPPEHYFSGENRGDSGPMYQGYDWDIIRLGNSIHLPRRDRSGYDDPWAFGMAHPHAFNMAFCDGAVHSLAYDMDITVYARFCCRKDKQVIDQSRAGF